MNEWMQAHPLVVCGVIGGLGLLLGVMLTLLVILIVEERRCARVARCEDVKEEKSGEEECEGEKCEDVKEEKEEEKEEEETTNTQ